MVKGISRRVIVVRAPDPRLFEEAIFIVKEEAFAKSGVTADEVLREAQRVADGYVRRNSLVAKKLRRLPPLAYTGVGALVATLCWAAAVFL